MITVKKIKDDVIEILDGALLVGWLVKREIGERHEPYGWLFQPTSDLFSWQQVADIAGALKNLNEEGCVPTTPTQIFRI